MSLIPNYGASLPKQYRWKAVGDIPELGIKKLFRMLLVGPSYSGKTNAIYHIVKHSPHVFAHLHIIARNPDQEIYDYLKDKLQGFITIYNEPPSVDAVRKTPLSSKAIELVIIDDYSSDKMLQRKVFSGFFIRGRHQFLSTIFLTHSYFSTDKLIRLNSEYVGILKANSKRDLKLIVSDFNIPNLTEDKLYQLYAKSTSQKGQLLLIDSVKSEVRFNFDRVVNLEEHNIE